MTPAFETILNRPVVVSELAFDVLFSVQHGEGSRPHGVEGHSHGASYGERIRAIAAANGELTGKGLAAGGNPAAALLETIRLLHDPHRRIFGWYQRAGALTGGFHVAESDDLAVRAVLENGTVTLTPISWDALHTSVADLLPDAPAIACVPNCAPERGNQRTDRPTGAPGLTAPEPAVPAGTLPHYAAQIFTARKDARGNEHRRGPLNYYQVEAGAFLAVHKTDESGQPQPHAVPASRTAFLRELKGL